MGAQPEPVVVGNNLTYTIGVTNNGPAAAANVSVTQLLPSGVVFVSASSSQGEFSQAGGVVTASLGKLSYGGSATITVVVLPAITGTITSTASVASEQPDPDPSNNSATVVSQSNPLTVDLAVGLLRRPQPGPGRRHAHLYRFGDQQRAKRCVGDPGYQRAPGERSVLSATVSRRVNGPRRQSVVWDRWHPGRRWPRHSHHHCQTDRRGL